MNWHINRDGYFEYIIVDFATWAEGAALENILPDGTIDESQLTDLYMTGTIDYVGDLGVGNDLVRIYYNATDEDGGTWREPLATMFADTAVSTIKEIGDEGTANLYSTDLVLKTTTPDEVMHIPAGSNIIDYAAALVESVGLQVIATACDAALPADASPVFTPEDDTYLSIVQYCCELANFQMRVDGWGRIILEPYIAPSVKAPSVFLRDDEECIFAPSIEYEYDTFDTPNVVKVVKSNAEGDPLVAIARNEAAIALKGYEVTYTKKVTDIETQEELQTHADTLLEEVSSNVQAVILTHSYKPFILSEVASIDYEAALRSFIMCAVSRTIKLSPLAICQTRFRRFLSE